MININCLNKIEEGVYEVCIIDERLKEMKYGRLYKYDYKSKKIKSSSQEDSIALYAFAILNSDKDIFKLLDEAIKNYKDTNLSEKEIANLFKNII